jgi:hypothetical protein
MINNSININKTVNHFSTQLMTLEIQVLACATRMVLSTDAELYRPDEDDKFTDTIYNLLT